jgi:Cys-rich protein (TIGR01571 family)
MPQRMPSLLGCTRKPIICANVFFCGCCIIGRQCNAVQGVANHMSIPYCLGSMLSITYPACVCCLRKRISEKYDLGENCCFSLIAALFCPCCSLIQTHKILRRNGQPPGLVCGGAPDVQHMDEPQKARIRQERERRRNERAARNNLRRQNRTADKWSSTESDSDSG